MDQHWVDDAKFTLASTSSRSLPRVLQPSLQSSSSCRNVFRLLAWREISPRAKHSSKRLWCGTSNGRTDSFGPRCEIIDARYALISWVEAESLRHLSAKYCPLLPPPRSTIAAAFSSDGTSLASTHGDHTVKIIDCQIGSCLKVLSGHRRTPWVVRFHPLHPEMLASGSLDHEVRLWDAHTADCIGSHEFYRPIASIAFHAEGELLAVASGHKLYIWKYSRRGEVSSPANVLKTRRSLRAVHFHPYAAPFLLTAEVNDLDSPDFPLTLATTSGYLQYPPPAVFFANVHSSTHPVLDTRVPLMPSPYLLWPTFVNEGERSLQQDIRVSGSVSWQQRTESTQRQTYANVGNQYDDLVSPMEISPGEPTGSNLITEIAVGNSLLTGMEIATSDFGTESMENFDGQPTNRSQRSSSTGITERTYAAHNEPSSINPLNFSGSADLQMLMRSVEGGRVHQFIPFSDPSCWELPFLQGWVMGQTHASLHTMLPVNSTLQGNLSAVHGSGPDFLASDLPHMHYVEALVASSAVETTLGHSRGTGRSGSRNRPHSHLMVSPDSREGAASLNAQIHDVESQRAPSNIESEISTSLATTTELPCTVKLRIWPHDIQNPCASLVAETCRLTIPHAVLCSEMGAHFSPCGRFLAACVACILPYLEGDPLQSQMHHDATGASTSPTRHPISAHQVMYELRIYSLEEATFGLVLASRAIRAAHCLTSIQFSPTSEHILLAYGRRHNSLLRSIVVDGQIEIKTYTILEVYRVSDMELVRILHSAEDEVNVACFHPLVGGGLVYGTKEGKLRIFQYDGPRDANCMGSNLLFEENMLEVQRYALEC